MVSIELFQLIGLSFSIYFKVLLVQLHIRHVKSQIEEKNCIRYIPNNYQKMHPPPKTSSGKPINVYTTLLVTDIDEINEAEMDFRLNTVFTQYWNDSRVRQNYTSLDHNLDECYHYMWIPDINFKSAKRVDTLTNRKVYFFVMEDGSIYLSIRYMFKVGCMMNFRMYPFDTQTCRFIISFVQTADSEAILKWSSAKSSPHKDDWNPVKVSKSIQLLQFNLLKPTIHSKIEKFYLENFTHLVANFTFVRRVTGSIVNTYAPSALIVFVAFVTFWIRVDAAPARVALSVTSLLTLCTQAQHYKMQLPAVNYLTAMDVWLFACIVMVFSTLVEFAVSYNNYTKSKSYLRKEIALLYPDSTLSNHKLRFKKNGWSSSPHHPTVDRTTNFIKDLNNVTYLDKFCRKLFPLSFILFIIIYWAYFMFNS